MGIIKFVSPLRAFNYEITTNVFSMDARNDALNTMLMTMKGPDEEKNDPELLGITVSGIRKIARNLIQNSIFSLDVGRIKSIAFYKFAISVTHPLPAYIITSVRLFAIT